MASINSVPVEVLRLILTPEDDPRVSFVPSPFVIPLKGPFMRATNPLHATHKDYVALRLVCRSFHAIVTPFVFAKLRIVSPEASFSRLTSIADDPNLRQYVKEYELAFWAEPAAAHVYRRHARKEVERSEVDLEMDGDEELFQGGGTVQMRLMEHYRKQFVTSRDPNPTNTTLEAVSKLPNLQSLAICIPTRDIQLVDVPSRKIRWGVPMIDTFLRIVQSRAEQADVTSITTLTMEGLPEMCFIIENLGIFNTTWRGAETLTKIHFTLSRISELALNLLGRFLRCATNLKSLHLARCYDDSFFFPCSLYKLRYLFVRHRVPGLVPPPNTGWNFLEDLTLNSFTFAAPLIIELILRHSRLRTLTLTQCLLETMAGRIIHPLETRIDRDSIDRLTETWPYVFTAIHAGRSSPLQNVRFDSLMTPHLVFNEGLLSPEEVIHWSELLTGRRHDFPQESMFLEVYRPTVSPGPSFDDSMPDHEPDEFLGVAGVRPREDPRGNGPMGTLVMRGRYDELRWDAAYNIHPDSESGDDWDSADDFDDHFVRRSDVAYANRSEGHGEGQAQESEEKQGMHMTQDVSVGQQRLVSLDEEEYSTAV
jgi:hypothetical protein